MSLPACLEGASAEQRTLAQMLVDCGQAHLFAAWAPHGQDEEQKVRGGRSGLAVISRNA